MAFTVPSNCTASSLLQSIVTDYEQRDAVAVGKKGSARTPNLLRQLTHSLKMTYIDVSASGFKRKSPTAFPTNTHGDLIIDSKSSPVISKRYMLHKIIATGTFSQIFTAQCLYTKQEVAIKVLRIGYDILGQREHALLRYFAKKCGFGGPQYCEFELND